MAKTASKPVTKPVGSAEQINLMAQYRHEAAEHRRILFERGSGLYTGWRDFRRFLQDMGPAPGVDYLITRLTANDMTYAPGKVAWIHRLKQPRLIDLLASMQSPPENCHTQLVTVRGSMVEYTALARALGVPFEAMAVAFKSGTSPEALVQQASIGETLIQDETPWLAPERRQAFFGAYRMWHMQVQPHYASMATPAFLFVYSALPNMLKLKNGLDEVGLWDPPTEKGKALRQEHDLWRRYCDNMARVESARLVQPSLQQYSLTTDVKAMWDHVNRTEELYRTGSEPGGRGAKTH
jgi:hypothetical protein